MKKIISCLLCALMLGGSVLAGCSADEAKDSNKDDPVLSAEAVASTDKYRNFYQIFVYSFCDSNDDGIGDLQGIISQLDYLNDGDPNGGNDLGIDALWLTPIMPSESYHKYSVEDYYNIDPDFGTLDDLDALVEECHKRGINIIMDLVLNHISYRNPLFLNACSEVEQGKLDGDAAYFEFHEDGYYSPDVNTISVGDYYCEANFSETMPEWNLSSDKTREEFEKIAKFWLDRGIDGFRLDACKYFSNKHTDGVEFLKWFTDTCRSIKEDVYLVGEEWDADSFIEELYTSGIDSLFAFRFAMSTGDIVDTINTQKGSSFVKKLVSYENKMREANPDFINAMFLSNHDQVRIANALAGRGADYERFAANLYMLAPGNSFTYYGEEIGMTAAETTGDAYYRLPMVFDSENLQDMITPGAASGYEAPENGGVKQQLEDENSLLNYYRRLIKVKLQNPEIARGHITTQQDFGEKEIGAYIVEYNGSKLLIIHNFSNSEAKELAITNDILSNAQIRAELISLTDGSHAALQDGKLTLPSHSSVILKSAE